MKNLNINKINIKKFFKTYFWYIVLVIAFIAIFVFSSVINNRWDFDKTNTSGAVGITIQVISTIITLIVSIIGLITSLQNEKCFGISFKEIYKLRTDPRIPYNQIIVISILLCFISTMIFFLEDYIFCLGVNLLLMGISIIVSVKEFPIILGDDKAIIKIIKCRLKHDLQESEEVSKQLKKTVGYLISEKTFKIAYEKLIGDNNDLDSIVFPKLLEYQYTLSKELTKPIDELKKREIADSLAKNIEDIVSLSKVPFSDHFEVISDNLQFVVWTIINIHDYNPNMVGSIINSLIYNQDYSKYDEEKRKYNVQILMKLITITVPKPDLSILELVKEKYSIEAFFLRDNKFSTVIFSLISFYLFYLLEEEALLPNENKKKIIESLNSHGIEDNRTILSWEELFKELLYGLNLNFDSFMGAFDYTRDFIEYFPLINEAKRMILNPGFAVDWYFSILLNSQNIFDIDFFSITDNETYKKIIKSEFDNCFDGEKFIPSQRMKRIVIFHTKAEKPFERFTMIEDKKHDFHRFINSLKYKELIDNIIAASNVENEVIAQGLRSYLENSLQKEYGYNNNIIVNDLKKKLFYNIIPKYPEAINYPQFLYENYEQGIYREIRNDINIEKATGRKQFNDKIKEINESNNKIVAVSKNLIDSLSYFVDNPNDKETFIKKCQGAQSFSSKILNGDIVFLNAAFTFNCVINKVEVRDLSSQEADDLVKEHQREDGQYVFEGTFVPQEEIKRIISKRFMVIRIEFSHKSLPETGIIQLNPFDKKWELNPN